MEINIINPSKEVSTQIHEEFKEGNIFTLNSFSGLEVLTVLITTSAIYLDKILNFFIKNREIARGTSIKISNKEIQLDGFTNEEITKMVKNGSLESIQRIINEDNDG